MLFNCAIQILSVSHQLSVIGMCNLLLMEQNGVYSSNTFVCMKSFIKLPIRRSYSDRYVSLSINIKNEV